MKINTNLKEIVKQVDNEVSTKFGDYPKNITFVSKKEDTKTDDTEIHERFK